MREKKLIGKLHSKLREEGHITRTVSVDHLCDLREGIEGKKIRGLLDEQIFNGYLESLAFKPNDVLLNAQSIIVVAAAQPQISLIFTHRGERHQVIMPPTYNSDIDKSILETLSSILRTEGYHVAKAALPLKLLAVRSELGKYGRNNICYVSGMGSFNRLMAFYTDLPCSEGIWTEPQMMERCMSCEACIHGCPTGAIEADRFLIHAERCITFHNERVNEFPKWIDPSWHNCLVGCLLCQKVCPENRTFLDRIEDGDTFSEEETALIMNATQPNHVPEKTAEKLKRIGMLEYCDILARNLRVLLNSPRSTDCKTQIEQQSILHAVNHQQDR
jgi:epoxyqueuosine reductase